MNPEKHQRNLIKTTNYGTYCSMIFETTLGKKLKIIKMVDKSFNYSKVN
jgi:hypothetical protein